MNTPMTRRAVTLMAMCGLCVISACGGDSGGGSSSPAAPTVSAPAINGTTDMVYIGQSVTFTAVGTGVKWGGDAPSVATIDATTGIATGVGTGRVTIWAENAGGRTTRLLRVLPSYNGSWSGSYAITGCQSAGGWALAGYCGSFYAGQVLNMNFQIAQNRDQVTGAFAFGSLVGTLNSGVVNEDGSLPLSGTIVEGNNTIQLQNLRATSPSAGTMKGQFDQVWGNSTFTGTGRLSCDIRNVTRTSGAPAFLSHAEPPPIVGLDDLFRAVLRR